MFLFKIFVIIYAFLLSLPLLPGSEDYWVTSAYIGIKWNGLNVFLLKNVIDFVLSKIHQEHRRALRLIGSGLSGLTDSLLCSLAIVRLDQRRTFILSSISEAFSQTAKRGLDKKKQLEQNGCYFYFFSAPRLLSTLKKFISCFGLQAFHLPWDWIAVECLQFKYRTS